MKEVDTSSKQWKRIQTWIFVLVLREYGANIYNDESSLWSLFEMSEEDIDRFFLKILNDDKLKWGHIARGINKQRHAAEVRSR